MVSAWHWMLEQLALVWQVISAGWTALAGFLASDSARQVELGVLTVLLGIVAAWTLGWLRRRMFIEFDRSILVRIAVNEGEDPASFANWPILIGPLPFASFDNQTVPNVQARDVVGFIVGSPRYIDDPDARRLPGWEPGYFAYGVIHWEHFGEVRALVHRGYYLQQAFLPNERGQPSQGPESRFLRFVTNAREQQGVADTIEGWRAPFRFQPYAKLELHPIDLPYRRLSLQLAVAFWICRRALSIARFVSKPYHWLCRSIRRILRFRQP